MLGKALMPITCYSYVILVFIQNKYQSQAPPTEGGSEAKYEEMKEIAMPSMHSLKPSIGLHYGNELEDFMAQESGVVQQ
jgi:hypothetical protein